jgi:multiple sugar transport system substrate-binding protein
VYKRFFLSALVLLACACAGGCREKSDQAHDGKIEVSHWDWFVTQGPTVDKEIELFEAAHLGIHVKRTSVQGDRYADLYALSQKSGEGPDVSLVPKVPTFLENVAQGNFMVLNGLPDFELFKKNYKPSAFIEGSNTVAGKIYSVPTEGVYPWLQLWINTKVFKDAGLVDAKGQVLVPKTLDDILNFSRQISKKSGGKVYGYGFGAKGGSSVWHWWWAQFCGLAMNWDGLNLKTGKYEYSKHPAYKAVLETLSLMQKENLITPQSLSTDDETARVEFATGKFGMLTAGIWVVNGWKQTNPEFKDYTVTALPLVGTPKAKSYFYYDSGGASWVINASSKHPNEAWAWYRWMLSKEAAIRWVKAGNSKSIFPEANVPSNISDPSMARVFAMGSLMRVWPLPALRNPDVTKVRIGAVKPDEGNILEGVLSGQITDIQAALADLDARRQANHEQAIADAVAAGAKVSMKDWVFEDWDPTKDYVQNAK